MKAPPNTAMTRLMISVTDRAVPATALILSDLAGAIGLADEDRRPGAEADDEGDEKEQDRKEHRDGGDRADADHLAEEDAVDPSGREFHLVLLDPCWVLAPARRHGRGLPHRRGQSRASQVGRPAPALTYDVRTAGQPWKSPQVRLAPRPAAHLPGAAACGRPGPRRSCRSAGSTPDPSRAATSPPSHANRPRRARWWRCRRSGFGRLRLASIVDLAASATSRSGPAALLPRSVEGYAALGGLCSHRLLARRRRAAFTGVK